MAEERMLNDEILLGLIKANSGGGGGGTTDYDDLSNKPQIGGVTLSGNQSASDLGLATTTDLAGKQDALTAGANINMAGNVVRAGVVEVVEPDMTVYGNSTESGSKTYTIETTGVYDIFYCLSLQSTVSVTLPNNANVLFENDLTVSNHPVKHIIAELHEGDTVTIAQTPSQWTAVVSGVLKLDAISVVDVAHTGSVADSTITYTLPNDNKYYLVVGACVGKPTGNNAVDNTSGGTPDITRTLTGSGARVRSVVVKGSDSPSFSFYGYDGGVASIIAYEIEFEEGNWDYNLATKNYVDTGLSGKQNTLTFDSVPTDGSTNPVESNGVYDALATKQDASGNSTLTTTDKTIVGAINEVNSNFTSLEAWTDADTKTVTGNPITLTDAAAVNAKALSMSIEPVQDLHGYDKPWVGGAGKNKLPLVLADIKAANTSGTWNDNAFTQNGVTFTIVSDSYGNANRIHISGTLSADVASIKIPVTLVSGIYKLSGMPYGLTNQSYLQYQEGSYWSGTVTGGNIGTIESSGQSAFVHLYIRATGTLDADAYPMLMLSTETDATFAPYTNICPISGLTSAEVLDEGKNMIPPMESGSYYVDTGGVQEDQRRARTDFIYLDSGTYTFSASTTQSKTINVGFSTWKNNSHLNNERKTDSGWQTVPYTFTVSNGEYCALIVRYSDDTNVNVNDIKAMLEKGSPATAYTPYVTPHTATITFGQTVYGGTVDFNTGKVRVNVGYYKPSSASDIYSNSGSFPAREFVVYPSPVGKQNGQLISNMFTKINSGITAWGTYITGSGSIRLNSDSTYNSAQDAYDELLKDAEFAYELATPTELTLTPAQLEMLKGHNTVSANGATISLTYQPDNLIGEVMEQVDAEVDGAKAYTDSKVAALLPTYPTTDGAYVLTATVSSGETVLSWESTT